MRQDVKDLADAMERGWKKVPKNCYWFFNDDSTVFNIPVEKVTSACAMGHALLGIGSTNTEDLKNFPILGKQRVSRTNSDCYPQTLEHILNGLLLKGWTTPEVVAWLRTHQDD